jgi:hypothetical protein
MQLAPVVSDAGFSAAGIEATHCHHSAVSAAKEPGDGPPESAMTIGTCIMSPTAAPANVMRILRIAPPLQLYVA